MPEYISIDEAAAEFKRSRNTIFKWIRTGKLLSYKAEGDMRTLVDREEVRNLIEPKPQS